MCWAFAELQVDARDDELLIDMAMRDSDLLYGVGE